MAFGARADGATIVDKATGTKFDGLVRHEGEFRRVDALTREEDEIGRFANIIALDFRSRQVEQPCLSRLKADYEIFRIAWPDAGGRLHLNGVR